MIDWQLDRDPELYNNELVSYVPNPNLRSISKMPTISTSDMLSVYEWNKKGKSIIKLNFENKILYCTFAGAKINLTKDECKAYLKSIDECLYKTLKEMLDMVHSIRIIKIIKN